MTQDAIRLGIIGAGMAARTAHIPAAERCDDFEVIAVMDRDASQLEGFRADARTRLCVELDDFLSTPRLDAVVVATPDATHAGFVAQALRRGLHVLVEKPMARSVEECRALVALAKGQGAVLAIGHEKRFHPTLMRIGELIAADIIGEPFFCGIHWASSAKLDAQFIPVGYERGYRWRWEDTEAGGGLLQDHLPHYVDLLRYWTGTDPVAVYARIRNIALDRLGWPVTGSAWEDFALVVVRFSSEMTLRLETSVVGRSLSPLWSVGSGIGEWTEYGYVLGTRGQLVFDLLPWDSTENGRIALWEREAALSARRGWSYVEQPEPTRRRNGSSGAAGQMFEGQLAAWARAIRGEPSTIARGRDGLVTIATVRAGYESARQGAEVRVVIQEPTTSSGPVVVTED